jgi:hypothetical protein
VRVVWVSFAPIERQAGKATSAIASVRYRLLLPSAALAAQGCDSRVTVLPPGASRRTLMERFRGAQAVVLGKVFAPEQAERVLGLVEDLKQRGVSVIADYSDDHFSHPLLGGMYRALTGAVDAIVASTPTLAEVVRAHARGRVSVVTDPVEGERGEPRVPKAPPYRLLWFGHPTNLDTLQYGLPQVKGHILTLVSAPGSGAERLGARFRPWTPQAVFEELRECDAVLIPSNPHDPRKAAKSPNRFTESVWAGRFVLAHPLPAYLELADFGWVGEDLGEGMKWLAARPDEALARIRHGQAAVAERFSPQAVAAAWKAAILRAGERAT